MQQISNGKAKPVVVFVGVADRRRRLCDVCSPYAHAYTTAAAASDDLNFSLGGRLLLVGSSTHCRVMRPVCQSLVQL